VELFEQHNVDGHPACHLNIPTLFLLFIMTKVLEFESEVEFVANINDHKDCLMSQDPTQDHPEALWFNIDIAKGHNLKAGDRVRITVEKL
jgi:hypothetical protein